MLKNLVVAAALLSSAGVASAKPLLIPAPMSHMRGAALIEIRHGSTEAAGGDSIRVMTDGRVIRIQRDDSGRMVGRDVDQLNQRQVKKIRSALRTATWSVTESRIRCFAYSPTFTDYVVHGDVMFRSQLCSGKAADETTTRAIAAIETIIAKAR